MASPSPICTVSDNGGGAQATTNGVNLTASTTTTIALASSAGVNVWSLTFVGQDELVTPPTITINQTNKTATFTAPGAGSALVLKSTVNSGIDVNGQAQASYSTTFAVYTLQSGNRVFATNETLEGSAAYGWITKINPLLRSGGGGGGSVPTGTGFYHITGGVADGSARAVNLGTADVTGSLALASVTAPTSTGVAKVSAGSWVAAASTIVDADVSGSAAIAGSKLAANLAITTSVAVGTNPASTGGFRLPNNTALVSRNAANNGDINLMYDSNADALFIGDPNLNQCIFQIFSGANFYFRFSGVDALAIYAQSIRAIQPITGEDTFYSTPYSAHGSATVAEGDTARTEVASIYKYTNIIYTGALTAGRTVTYPLPADLAHSYHKAIFNNTTGGFAITFTNTGGTTVAIAAGKTAILVFEPAGVRRITPDT